MLLQMILLNLWILEKKQLVSFFLLSSVVYRNVCMMSMCIRPLEKKWIRWKKAIEELVFQVVLVLWTARTFYGIELQKELGTCAKVVVRQKHSVMKWCAIIFVVFIIFLLDFTGRIMINIVCLMTHTLLI